MTTASLPTPATEPAPLSEGARLLHTFIAPRKTFTDLRRSAAWWAPFVVVTMISIIFAAVVDKQVGFRKVVENQIQLSPKQADKIDKLPADQREKVMEQQTAFWRGFSFGFPVVTLIFDLVIAAILFATFKLGLSADLEFKTSFAIIMYANLPLALKSVFATLSLFAGVNADSFLIQNPVASNPGYFVNPVESRLLFSLGSARDVFMIWTLVLTAIGFSCAGKIKRSSALIGVFGWYLVFVLAGAGLSAAFS